MKLAGDLHLRSIIHLDQLQAKDIEGEYPLAN